MMKKGSCEIAADSKSLLIVISGPSGVGKDAVLARLKESGHPFERIVTVTTRPRRPAERDGVDYRFLISDKYREMLERGEFLESARVYGNWYGVPKEAVTEALKRGRDVVIKVDVQGAATIKKILPQAMLIYLAASSKEELADRLKKRSTESAADLALRVKVADEELKQQSLFDYVIMNKPGEIDRTVSDIMAIIKTEKCRVNPRKVPSS